MRPPIREAARAFGVVFGPSVLLDTAAGSLASSVHALRRHRRPSRAVALASGLIGAYFAIGRPLMLHWGATCEELREPLPGDDLVEHPAVQSTRAVTVEAPPEAVWPWLAQLGQDRAGFYSYEWLENLAGCEMRNADRIHHEWQHRELGDIVHLHPAGGLKVNLFQPQRALGLEGWGTFADVSVDKDRTRLIARGGVPRGAAAALYAVLMEIPHFLMERRMLLGIKQRTEASRP